jgi:hypothetical protein
VHHTEIQLLDDSGVSWARRCACGDRWPCEALTVPSPVRGDLLTLPDAAPAHTDALAG